MPMHHIYAYRKANVLFLQLYWSPNREGQLNTGLGSCWVYFDKKMFLSDHINIIAEKSFRNVGFVLRACKPFKDIVAIKSVYCAYVRSVLEYASPVWSSQYNIYISLLERIQKHLIKHISFRFRRPTIEDCHKNNL